jgi:hypothetical protein
MRLTTDGGEQSHWARHGGGDKHPRKHWCGGARVCGETQRFSGVGAAESESGVPERRGEQIE